MIDADAYCRAVEAHLCRKNDGHLIRIAGPAFDLVRRWAAEGIPIGIACAGIDRTFARYSRKGPRRRPLRIEYCEADVLDAFDEWRRAVGVARLDAAAGLEPDGVSGTRRRGSLASHVEQAIARLTALRGRDRLGIALDEALERAVRTLDGLQAEAARARGEAREAMIATLARVDADLAAAAAAAVDAAERSRLIDDAEAELAPFRARLTGEQYARARDAAVARLVRDRLGLPRIAYE